MASIEKQTRLIELLQNSVLVSADSRQNILARLNELDDDQADALIEMLEQSEHQQRDVLQNILQRNPKFINELESFAEQKIDQAYKKSAAAAQDADLAKAAELEAELASL